MLAYHCRGTCNAPGHMTSRLVIVNDSSPSVCRRPEPDLDALPRIERIISKGCIGRKRLLLVRLIRLSIGLMAFVESMRTLC